MRRIYKPTPPAQPTPSLRDALEAGYDAAVKAAEGKPRRRPPLTLAQVNRRELFIEHSLLHPAEVKSWGVEYTDACALASLPPTPPPGWMPYIAALAGQDWSTEADVRRLLKCGTLEEEVASLESRRRGAKPKANALRADLLGIKQESSGYTPKQVLKVLEERGVIMWQANGSALALGIKKPIKLEAMLARVKRAFRTRKVR